MTVPWTSQQEDSRRPAAVRLDGQQVLIGEDSAAELPRLALELGFQRPLIVTTRSTAAPALLEKLRSYGWQSAPRVFAAAHAPIEAVREASEAFRSSGADGAVAIGGGSAIDTAKLIALDAMSDGHALDAIERAAEQVLDLTPRSDAAVPDRPGPPIVTVSTTASQAEFTDIAGISLAGGGKVVVRHAAIRPAVAVLDAAFARTTPPRLWAATAVKAMDSAVLTLAGLPRGAHLAVSLTQAAFRTIHDVLRGGRAGAHGSAAEITQVQTAAWLAMAARSVGGFDRNQASQGWPGAVIRHQLGGLLGIPHGEIAGVVMPHLFRHAVPGSSLVAARALEGSGVASLTELSAALTEMLVAQDLPVSLSDLGVAPSSLASVGGRVDAESAGAWPADVVTRLLDAMLLRADRRSS